MKQCSLHDFIAEMRPWLDSNYINLAMVQSSSQFALYFNDGTRNVYRIDDCNREQINDILSQLKERGIRTETPENWEDKEAD